MKLDLVYNPYAGSFRQHRLDDLARAFASEGVDVRLVASPREWTPAGDPPDLACIHGGDGTLRDAVQALGRMAGAIPLCIAPSGTINLVAREVGYARDPERLAAQVMAAWRRGPEGWLSAPLYRLGDLPVVACLSIGPDSHAVAHVSGALKKRVGRLAYVVAMMRVLRHWPRETMRVSGELADGTPFACEAGAVIASHGALYAGRYRLSPKAALRADAVELIVLTRPSRLGIMAAVAAAFAKLPLDRLGLAEIRSIRRASFDRCVHPVQVDGDHIEGAGMAIEPAGITLRYVI
ncbi:diacylglycerol/lipid kinase family protein [Tsuneonella amylolytica]|uniref:diacylglycerol/lipid kinase family protein n=1 Tax=Tsuneonella amylolytica TaxID=2338327 RepID=UPI000EA87A53|nr:diacylglycerol kinase family protein [Tsuneonella amylolytica]